MNNVQIRKVYPGEEQELRNIFLKSVHTICAKDYTQAQLNAWAPIEFNKDLWCERIRKNRPHVVVFENSLIAFADIQNSGYIDQFFVSPQWVGQGIGKLLMSKLEDKAISNSVRMLSSNVSITAKPFFHSVGFWTEAEQVIEISEESLKNFKMRKIIGSGSDAPK